MTRFAASLGRLALPFAVTAVLLSGCAAEPPGEIGPPAGAGPEGGATPITGPAFSDTPTCEELFFGSDPDPVATFRGLLRDVDDDRADQYVNETSNVCGLNENIGQSVVYTMVSVGVDVSELNVQFDAAPGDEVVDGVTFPGEIDGWRLVGSREFAEFRALVSRSATDNFCLNIQTIAAPGVVRGTYVDFPEALANHGCPQTDLSVYRDPAGVLPVVFTSADSTQIDGATCVADPGAGCGVIEGGAAWTVLTLNADAVSAAAAVLAGVRAAN